MNGAFLTKKTPGSAQSESCCPSCSKGWSGTCLLGPVSSAQSTTAGHVRAFADSRAEVPLNENSTPACTGLHQEGWGPACIFDRRFLPRVLTGGFPDNPEARPGYVPKVPTTPFRDQVVSLQALPPEEADPTLALLYAVRALRCYIDRTQSFRTSDQLFVCQPAEGECRLQAEDGSLDSGRHHPGLSGTGCALPIQVESG